MVVGGRVKEEGMRLVASWSTCMEAARRPRVLALWIEAAALAMAREKMKKVMNGGIGMRPLIISMRERG